MADAVTVLHFRRIFLSKLYLSQLSPKTSLSGGEKHSRVGWTCCSDALPFPRRSSAGKWPLSGRKGPPEGTTHQPHVAGEKKRKRHKKTWRNKRHCFFSRTWYVSTGKKEKTKNTVLCTIKQNTNTKKDRKQNPLKKTSAVPYGRKKNTHKREHNQNFRWVRFAYELGVQPKDSLRKNQKQRNGERRAHPSQRVCTCAPVCFTYRANAFQCRGYSGLAGRKVEVR